MSCVGCLKIWILYLGFRLLDILWGVVISCFEFSGFSGSYSRFWFNFARTLVFSRWVNSWKAKFDFRVIRKSFGLPCWNFLWKCRYWCIIWEFLFIVLTPNISWEYCLCLNWFAWLNGFLFEFSKLLFKLFG